ncbi:hypothetical protein C8Q80DRAFT_503438 [Daedaleopsis nitida]|nr:hypothetical protein C8Q80DRAFT_503438 [Daedaleopsis nitida]
MRGLHDVTFFDCHPQLSGPGSTLTLMRQPDKQNTIDDNLLILRTRRSAECCAWPTPGRHTVHVRYLILTTRDLAHVSPSDRRCDQRFLFARRVRSPVLKASLARSHRSSSKVQYVCFRLEEQVASIRAFMNAASAQSHLPAHGQLPSTEVMFTYELRCLLLLP